MNGRNPAAALFMAAAVLFAPAAAEPPSGGGTARRPGTDEPRPPAEPGPDGDAPPGDDLGPACPCHPGAGTIIQRLPLTPQECFDQWRHALIQGNRDAVWNLLSESSRDALEREAEDARSGEGAAALGKQLGLTAEELAEADPKDLALGLILAGVGESAVRELLDSRLRGVRMSGDAASARREFGEISEMLYFSRKRVIDGWKIDWIRTREEAAKAAAERAPK